MSSCVVAVLDRASVALEKAAYSIASTVITLWADRLIANVRHWLTFPLKRPGSSTSRLPYA